MHASNYWSMTPGHPGGLLTWYYRICFIQLWLLTKLWKYNSNQWWFRFLVWAISDIIFFFFKVDLQDSFYSFARNSSINILIIQMTAIMVCYTWRLFYIYTVLEQRHFCLCSNMYMYLWFIYIYELFHSEMITICDIHVFLIKPYKYWFAAAYLYKGNQWRLKNNIYY